MYRTLNFVSAAGNSQSLKSLSRAGRVIARGRWVLSSRYPRTGAMLLLVAMFFAAATHVQANTVTLSNGNNLATGIAAGDILSLEGVSAGGTLILDNYQLLGVNGNGNANTGFGTGSNNNTFTLTNGSYYTMAGTVATRQQNTGYGASIGWGAGASTQVGGGTSTGQTLNVQSGSLFAIGRRFAVANQLSNHVNVDGAGSMLIDSNANNNNPVGGTWSVTNGGKAIVANHNFSSSTTFNATVGGAGTNGYGSTWHSPGGLNLPNTTNSLTINSGGFLEFEGVTGGVGGNVPAFTLNNANTVTINGGGLSYGQTQTPAAYSGDLLGSNAGSTANTIGAFNWSGNNSFRIDGGAVGITDNGTTAYTFSKAYGSKNYQNLQLYGNCTINRQVNFSNTTAGAGSLLLSGATANLGGMQTNDPVERGTANQVNVTAVGGVSQLTVAGGIQGTGGLTLTSSSNGTLKLMSAGNGYGGQTLINGGVLAAGADNTMNSSSNFTVSTGTLDISGFTGQGFAALTVGANGVFKTGTVDSFTSGNISLITGSSILINNPGGTLTSFPYLLGTYSGSVAGTNFTNILYNGSDAVGGGLPAGASLVFSGGNVKITGGPSFVPTTCTLAASADAINIHVSGAGGITSSTITTTIVNNGTTGGNSDSLNYTSLGSSVAPTTGTTLGSAAGSGTVAPNTGGTANATANQAFSSTNAGQYTFTPSGGAITNTNLGGSITPSSTTTTTVNVYALAAASGLPTTVTLPNVHVGGTFGTQTVAVSNGGSGGASHTEGLDAEAGTLTGDASSNGGTFTNLPVGDGSNSNIVVGLASANTATAGARTGTVSVTLNSNGTISGLTSTSLTSQNITVNGGVYDYAAASTVSGSLGNYHVGVTSPLSIQNTASAGSYSEDLSASIAAGTNTTVSGSMSGLLAGSTDSSSLQVTLGGGSGPQTGTLTVSPSSAGTVASVSNGLGATALAEQTVDVTGTGYNLAVATVGSSTINLGTVHKGASFGSATISIQNSAELSAYSENLNVAVANNGVATASGSITGLTPQSTDNSSLTVSLNSSSTPGLVSSTVPLTLTSDGSGSSGLGTTALSGQTVTVQGNVYSGQAGWNLATGGNWSPDNNWADTLGNGSPGAPGIYGFAGDTATFGNTIGSGTVSVAVNTPVIVAGLTFNNTLGGSYTLSGGSLNLDNGAGTAAVSVTSGTQTIDSTTVLTLASSTNMDIAAASELKIQANIGESGGIQSLTKLGLGTLVLSGTNNYSGGTVVNAGILAITSSSALPDGHRLTVGAGGTLIFDPSFSGSPVQGMSSIAASSVAVNPVPEPGTLALLFAGLVVGLGVWRRGRKKV